MKLVPESELSPLIDSWWTEPDGIWAVNLSKRSCAESLKRVLDKAPTWEVSQDMVERAYAASESETMTRREARKMLEAALSEPIGVTK